MNIKTEVVSEEVTDGYPMMMISKDGLIVHFRAEREGTLVLQPKDTMAGYRLYEFSKTWSMDCFMPFKGSFTTTCS